MFDTASSLITTAAFGETDTYTESDLGYPEVGVDRYPNAIWDLLCGGVPG
ncbi:MAG: hypothetical protein ACYDDU_12465 [Dermatophilaceae bacterium]